MERANTKDRPDSSSPNLEDETCCLQRTPSILEELRLAHTAIIGHTGFVGRNLVQQHSFQHFYSSRNIHTIEGQTYDVVVCCGAPGTKYLANKFPDQDRASIEKLKTHVQRMNVRRLFILISTIDVYAQVGAGLNEDDLSSPEQVTTEPYGRHRYELEQFVRETFPERHLIVRLPGVFGPYLKKNIIYDLINGNIGSWVVLNAQFQFYDLRWLWRDITEFLQKYPELLLQEQESVIAATLPRIWNLFTEPLPQVVEWIRPITSQAPHEPEPMSLVRAVSPSIAEKLMELGTTSPTPARYASTTRYPIYSRDESTCETRSYVHSAKKVFDALRDFIIKAQDALVRESPMPMLGFSMLALEPPVSISQLEQTLEYIKSQVLERLGRESSSLNFALELVPTRLHDVFRSVMRATTAVVNPHSMPELKQSSETKGQSSNESEWVTFWHECGCWDERKGKLKPIVHMIENVGQTLRSALGAEARVCSAQSLLFRVPLALFAATGKSESAPTIDGLRYGPQEIFDHITYRVMPYVRDIAWAARRNYDTLTDNQHTPVLVFGCPKQRSTRGYPQELAEQYLADFFRRLGIEAERRGLRVGIEANPKQYGADILTDYDAVCRLVQTIDHPAITVHFDTGCHYLSLLERGIIAEKSGNEMAQFIGEDALRILHLAGDKLSHIHISQPGLKSISCDGGETDFPHSVYAEVLDKVLSARSPSLPPVYLSVEQLPATEANHQAVLDQLVQSLCVVLSTYLSSK